MLLNEFNASGVEMCISAYWITIILMSPVFRGGI